MDVIHEYYTFWDGSEIETQERINVVLRTKFVYDESEDTTFERDKGALEGYLPRNGIELLSVEGLALVVSREQDEQLVERALAHSRTTTLMKPSHPTSLRVETVHASDYL